VALLDGVTVLYLEDDSAARATMSRGLERLGARVLPVASAQMALLAFEEHQPDVIVSDLSLPDVDGWAFLRAVRGLPSEREKRTPAIMLTADSAPGVRKRSLLAGYALHLTKPVPPDALANRVALLLASRGAR
jgi:CheY-like chemotaxis protein